MTVPPGLACESCPASEALTQSAPGFGVGVGFGDFEGDGDFDGDGLDDLEGDELGLLEGELVLEGLGLPEGLFDGLGLPEGLFDGLGLPVGLGLLVGLELPVGRGLVALGLPVEPESGSRLACSTAVAAEPHRLR